MLTITKAKRSDWKRFSHLHYRGNGLGPVDSAFIAHIDGAEAGMVVICYAGLAAMGRRGRLPDELVLGHNADRGAQINQRLRVLERLVVKPSFEGQGIGRALIGHALEHASVEFIEAFSLDPRVFAGTGFVDHGPNPLEANRQRLINICEGLGVAPELLKRASGRQVFLDSLSDRQRTNFVRIEEGAFRYWLRSHGGVCRRWEKESADTGRVPAKYLSRFWSRIDQRVHYLLWGREVGS